MTENIGDMLNFQPVNQSSSDDEVSANAAGAFLALGKTYLDENDGEKRLWRKNWVERREVDFNNLFN